MIVAIGTFLAIICRGLGWLFFLVSVVLWLVAFIQHEFYWSLFLWPALSYGFFFLVGFFSNAEYFQ